ncbi:3-methyl-2-oxobutanoate hydroxymethyltransferase [Bacteroidota bacterium]
MISVSDFKKYKNEGKPISMVTCYDFWSAKIIDQTGIDAVLVGDSVSMVMHGYDNTTGADLEMMRLHVAAVKKGLTKKFLIADMPFLAHRKGLDRLMDAVDTLVKAGAQAVKIEGANGHIELISHIVNSGVPVMGHLGLTPQSIHQLGGYKVQGKENKQAEQLIKDSKSLEKAGCFGLVLELVPAQLAKQITDELSIPTIGIGAGPYTSGQVLVLQDLLGMDKDFEPKFLRKYLNGYDMIKEALNKYNADVKSKSFPSEEESF